MKHFCLPLQRKFECNENELFAVCHNQGDSPFDAGDLTPKWNLFITSPNSAPP